MTDSPITLGDAADAHLNLDLGQLIGAHLGIVANSGGGKSGLIRKILETTHGHIQHIVLDSEDEFYTLRERHDYVIAGGDGGDTPAIVDNAAQLALAALTHGFSLICQINDLGRAGANEFIDRFLTAMIGAPRALWHPCLVVIDEVQRFDETAIGKLTGEGRKRGFTAVLATQRLPKMDANVRGDLNNWIMGRVGQSLDRRNMADQLGMAPKEARELAQIPQRHFYAFGPALSRDPLLFRVGDVQTTMVRPGQAKVQTPPPPEALREILAGLAAEPKIDEATHNELPATHICDETLKRRVAELEAERDEWAVERGVGQQQLDALAAENRALREIIGTAWTDIQRIRPALEGEPFAQTNGQLVIALDKINCSPAREANAGGSHEVARPKNTKPEGGPVPSQSRPPYSGGIPASQQRVLDAIAWWEAIGIRPVERHRASVIAGLSPKASTFGVYVSKLAQAGLVDTSTPGSVALTDDGRAAANSPGKVNRRDVVLQARAMLKPAAANVFDEIVARYPNWIERGELADIVGLSRTASTLGVYISESSKLGFVETKPGVVRAADWMMP